MLLQTAGRHGIPDLLDQETATAAIANEGTRNIFILVREEGSRSNVMRGLDLIGYSLCTTAPNGSAIVEDIYVDETHGSLAEGRKLGGLLAAWLFRPGG